MKPKPLRAVKRATVEPSLEAKPALAPIKVERTYLEREKVKRVMSRIAQRVKRLKKRLDECDSLLEDPMPQGTLVRLRDGRAVERVIVPVKPIIVDDAWLAEHPDRVARKGYEFVDYKVSEVAR